MMMKINSNRRAACVDRNLFEHVPLDRMTDAEQVFRETAAPATFHLYLTIIEFLT